MTIRKLENSELKNIYTRIKQDFSVGEYPPYLVLLKLLKKGILKGFILCDEGHDVAYSFCADDHANGFVLISLISVFENFRGRGLGSAFLGELSIKYSDKQGIIVEVEKPENASSEKEKSVCEKRIAFYEKAGYQIIPNIDYAIWDIPMHLMALPRNTDFAIISENIGQIIYDIYLMLMGKIFMYKLKFKKLGDSSAYK